MKFNLTPAFIEKATRVVLSEMTPFDVVKKIFDLTEIIQLKDKYGRPYTIPEDILVKYMALKKIVSLQVIDQIPRGEQTKFSDYFNELNEFEKHIKKHVSEIEVISASPEDIKFIEKQTNGMLKYNIVDSQATKIINFLQDFQDDSNSLQIEDLVEDYSDLIAQTNSAFLGLRNTFDDKKRSFTMEKPEYLEELLDDYRKSINNKSRYVKTGIKWLNDTMGGWEKDRFYLAIAASGRGKSVFLLNSAIWAIKYNSYEDVVKTGRTPVVLYLTLENTIIETLMRLMGYVGGKKLTDEFKKGKISIEDASKILMADVVNKNDRENSAKLRIEYRNKGTQTMDDIKKILNDIEADGKHKVVFVAIDYIDSIKSSYIKKDDVRMGLDALGKEFSNMAKDREIPVLSAMQLNRDATVKIESGSDDIEEYLKNVRGIGASHIAESLRLIQLVDLALVIDKRKGETNEHPDTLAFRIAKSRVELEGIAPARLHMHDFLVGNGMKLIEDIYDATSSSVAILPQETNKVVHGSTAPAIKPRSIGRG